MIVWFFHVKVGHRQTPILKPPTDVGGFLHTCRFCRFGDREIMITLLLFLNKSTEVTVNRLEYLKSNDICVNML